MKNMICEYSYAPKGDRVKSLVLVSGCMAAAIGMLAVSETGGVLEPFFKAGSAAWVLVALLFAARLLVTGYVYSVYRDFSGVSADLVITELRFGKSRQVCRVSLFDVKKMWMYDPTAEKERARREGKKRVGRIKRPRPDRKDHWGARAYNYCVDILPARYCLIFVAEGAYVKFSPDDRLMEIIKRYL